MCHLTYQGSRSRLVSWPYCGAAKGGLPAETAVVSLARAAPKYSQAKRAIQERPGMLGDQDGENDRGRT
jgi:hypothetical protein